MELNPEEKETVNFYNKNAIFWSNDHNAHGFWDRELKMFHKYLPSGRIFEVGAGGGRDARCLIAFGYEYIGTDISEELLREARKNNPKSYFEKQSVYDLDFCGNVYLVLYANINKKEISHVLAETYSTRYSDGF